MAKFIRLIHVFPKNNFEEMLSSRMLVLNRNSLHYGFHAGGLNLSLIPVEVVALSYQWCLLGIQTSLFPSCNLKCFLIISSIFFSFCTYTSMMCDSTKTHTQNLLRRNGQIQDSLSTTQKSAKLIKSQTCNPEDGGTDSLSYFLAQSLLSFGCLIY